jgi:hypothetical protein
MAESLIIANQLNRRNISQDQRMYLTGKRYKEEKKTYGGDRKSEEVKPNNNEESSGNNYHLKKTEERIAEQTKVSPKTVRNAEKFADAVDKVSESTGI